MALHHYRLRGVLSASSRAVCPGFCRFNSLGGLTTSLSQPCWRGSSLTRGYSLLANGCGYSAGAATRRLLIGLGPTSVTRNHLLLLSTAPVVTTLLGALTRRLTWSFAYTLAMLRFSLGCVRVRCHSTAPAPFHGASPPQRLHLLAPSSISWQARALLAGGGKQQGFLILRGADRGVAHTTRVRHSGRSHWGLAAFYYRPALSWCATPDQTYHMRCCPVPRTNTDRPGRLIRNASRDSVGSVCVGGVLTWDAILWVGLHVVRLHPLRRGDCNLVAPACNVEVVFSLPSPPPGRVTRQFGCTFLQGYTSVRLHLLRRGDCNSVAPHAPIL